MSISGRDGRTATVGDASSVHQRRSQWGQSQPMSHRPLHIYSHLRHGSRNQLPPLSLIKQSLFSLSGLVLSEVSVKIKELISSSTVNLSKTFMGSSLAELWKRETTFLTVFPCGECSFFNLVRQTPVPQHIPCTMVKSQGNWAKNGTFQSHGIGLADRRDALWRWGTEGWSPA